MRLDRLLSKTDLGSRKEVGQMIRKGLITINGQVCKDRSAQVSPEDDVRYDGMSVVLLTEAHIMMYKPAGVVSAIKDARHETVYELLDGTWLSAEPKIVGRLDQDTTGLLLLTSDGTLLHRLTRPGRDVWKTYHVVYDGTLPQDAVQRVEKGLLLDDGMTLPATLELIADQEARLTISEGRNHQVKRMFSALGCTVTALHREQVGPIVLDECLQPGESRLLSDEEVEALYQAVDLQRGVS